MEDKEPRSRCSEVRKNHHNASYLWLLYAKMGEEEFSGKRPGATGLYSHLH